MPPKGSHESIPKSKKPEGTSAKLIDILKPGSDENIELGDSVAVIEFDKIDSPHKCRVIPSQGTWGQVIPDEETRVAAEVLQALNKQPRAGGHPHWTQSTPLDEAEHFEGGGLAKNI